MLYTEVRAHISDLRRRALRLRRVAVVCVEVGLVLLATRLIFPSMQSDFSNEIGDRILVPTGIELTGAALHSSQIAEQSIGFSLLSVVALIGLISVRHLNSFLKKRGWAAGPRIALFGLTPIALPIAALTGTLPILVGAVAAWFANAVMKQTYQWRSAARYIVSFFTFIFAIPIFYFAGFALIEFHDQQSDALNARDSHAYVYIADDADIGTAIAKQASIDACIANAHSQKNVKRTYSGQWMGEKPSPRVPKSDADITAGCAHNSWLLIDPNRGDPVGSDAAHFILAQLAANRSDRAAVSKHLRQMTGAWVPADQPYTSRLKDLAKTVDTRQLAPSIASIGNESAPLSVRQVFRSAALWSALLSFLIGVCLFVLSRARTRLVEGFVQRFDAVGAST